MVRETNNVCFGQIAQETQVVVREDNKRDHLKRSNEDVTPPNFSERNSGYYERSSRLVAENDSYIRRSNNNNNNNNTSAINSYQSSNNSSSSNNKNNNSSSSNNNNSSFSNNPDNRSRTRDRLYRNGPHAVGVSSGSAGSSVLSERTSSGASSKNNNSRVPPTSWYEAAATYTNGPGGSGNADVSAANINNNHYQTAASTDLQAAAITNSTTTSSYTAYSYASSPAQNNTASSSTTSSSFRNTILYGNVTQTDKDSETISSSTTPPLLNKNKHKLLKSSSLRSGSSSPTTAVAAATAAAATGATLLGEATMTSSASGLASSSSSSTSTSNNNSSRINQTANNSCSSVSSTINSNTNNNSLSGHHSSLTNPENTHSGGGGGGVSGSSVGGILNAAALAAAASKGGSSADGHKNSGSGNNTANSSSNVNTSSNNPSTSASHHTSRSAAHAHFHGRSTTSSSRSHSRSPSSYSSSHSSSSSSSSTASSHACSPVGGRDVEPPSIANVSSNRSGTRSLQSAVAVPPSSSGLNHPSGSNVCGSSSSSTSSTSSGTPTGNPVVHSEDNRPLAIRVRNLPARSSDTSLKDGLFHEYKKHGKVTWVKVVGQNAERYALVCFKKPEDVEKALEVSHDKLFFGCKIEVEPYQGYDVEDNEFRPYEAELDEYHPKSTRTLFIGNLEKEITSSELRQHFECFGEIIEIDIKKQGMSAYAFCQYSDIVSVVKAMRKMDGEHLGNNRIKLGFGKSMPTNCVWIDGIGEKISESHLQSQFSRYGAVSKVVVDRQRQLALVLYEQIQYAQTAVKEMRGATLRGRKLQVDFASRECQDAFYEKMEKQSAGSRFSRYESQSRSRASSFSRHQNSNDGCSPGNTPGSSSSSSAGLPSSAPALSSAIVAGTSNITSGNTLSSVVGQTSGNTTPARSRGSRSSRHTMDYEYLDTRRFRSCDEYSQGSATSHDEENSIVNHPSSSSNVNSYSGIGLRSDSPLLSRLGPIVNNTGKESSNDMLEMALSRRLCDKSPAKLKGDIRLFQKERAVLLEQLEECPSSGDESVVSPRKRIKIDHHSIKCGLTQSHSVDELQPQHKNSNCDYLLNDPMHRKSDVRRLSECSSSLNKYSAPQQNHHHSHHAVPPPPHHHHHQQQLSRRPSIDYMATSGGSGGVGNLSVRHNSNSSSNSDHHPPPHQSNSSLACKRRRIIGGSGGNSAAVGSSSLLSSSTTGSGSNLSSFANDDSHHHTSRGRGHQLHSHHSHEASGGESADGSRPGTPLCDERPEVLPSEPRRVPRERPREPMVLPLPKFGIQFFHQYRSSLAAGNAAYHHHHHGSSSFTSSSAVASGNNSGNAHLHSNNMLNRSDSGINSNNHSSLSHSSSSTVSASTAAVGVPPSGGCYLPSPSARYTPHWRPHHHHHHPQHGSGHHGPSGGATPSSSSSMVSPMRSRSLSSNSSDSDVPGQSLGGSPSLEERIRSLDEMYERWSGNSSNGTAAIFCNAVKRHDFNNAPPTWQHHRSNSQSDHHNSNSIDVRPSTSAAATNRPKFLDIDVNELQPSEIVKSVLAKKSIFDDDLQRLKKNQWYEPTPDSSQLSKNMGASTSSGLPNLQATKAPVVGCSTTASSSASSTGALSKPPGALIQRVSSCSPMNSPQASMSPYNSPSPSPSVTASSVPLISGVSITKATSISTCSVSGSQNSNVTAATSTSPASSSGTKCLQYPFPTHPPLPNTAAPVQSAQPIPPPPAESSKPSMVQPPLPPMEVSQPPQPPATSPNSSSSAGISSKPKTSALSKSLSVPPPPPTTATTESRVLTKSVSVPGSTNMGTVKSSPTTSVVGHTSAPHLEQNQPQQSTAGSSSLNPPKFHSKEDDSVAKTPSHTSSSSTFETAVKRSDKSHKHNHRSNDEKKSSKNDKRKNSNSSQSYLSQASAAESSDADEHDSKKERKERHERREKELRRQQEREERAREEREREERDHMLEKERLEKERLEKEQLEKERLEKERLEKERLEKERLEKERLEKECLEKERLERERLEREERERIQREKDRIRKEEEQRAKEERERKEKEDKERKLNEQREREENEKRKREEMARREHEEREEQLRKERKEHEEFEQKEKLERLRLRDEKDGKFKDECGGDKRDINLLKEHQRRKENTINQMQTKSGNDMSTATSQTAHDFFRQGDSERQNNKENSTDETSPLETSATSSGKLKNRKTSRNTSPVRHPKRRLSSQESNVSNSANSAAYTHIDDNVKRMRIDQTQTLINNHNSVNNATTERRNSKEHHAKDRNNKHNRTTSSSGHKSNIANSNEKDNNTKHHRNKHHHKPQTNQQASTENADNNLMKTETEHIITNCVGKPDDDHQTEHEVMEVKPKISSLLSSDDEENPENTNVTTPQNSNKSGNSNSHKHREHGSSHHSRHKSNKRDREHHREKKRHSNSTSSSGPATTLTANESVPSTPTSANCNATDEEIMSTSGNQLTHKRNSGHANARFDTKSKFDSSERKLSRCSDDGSSQQHQTPSHRHNNFSKSTPQLSSRRMLLSSAEDTDCGGEEGGMGPEDDDDSDNRTHSIFDIPDDGPYVSMYDKVKARSCKNMQKQEEEKKIKAKFSQLKQSRAKREEKKRSTSYDGDSDSDFDAASGEHQKQQNRSGSYKMLSGGLSSTDNEQDVDAGGKTPSRDRRRGSQASSSAASGHPHRLCSDSDDNSVTQRRLKIQDNLRRLCDDGDDTSEDDLIRRHNTGLTNKRLLHHTSRIASDSESQSQSAADIKLKQEPLETSNNDVNTTPALKHLKQKIKKEVDAMEASGENSDFGDYKFKRLGSLCSSADEQATSQNIKFEGSGELLSANEIKKEIKDYYAEEYLQTEQKFSHKSPMASASQHCSPEQMKIKKHKKSKKRQKTPTHDAMAKDQFLPDALAKHSSQSIGGNLLNANATTDTKNTVLLQSPCYDVFDELKRGDTLVTTNTSTDLQVTCEKKRHKDRKEKKREKLRHMSADVGSGVEMDKLAYEKEKHRLKKSKKSKSLDIMRQTSTPSVTTALVQQIMSAVPAPSTPQHKRSGGEKMEDIFGPISDEDEDDMTDSDIGGSRDLNCIPNRNTSSANMPGPIVSAALNPYKQEPLTPKSHTVEENEENKQKLTCPSLLGSTTHLERVAERQHRKEKREKKRKEREKSRSSDHNQSMGFMPSTAVSSNKPLEDENSVDLDAAGRALEAQLMEDSDNKLLEDTTPSTANTYRSDMTDVFLFSDCDENSLEMCSTNKPEKKDTEKEHTASISCKNKEKKKKKKRSKEEKQLHHQRRESPSSNTSQLSSNMVAPSSSSTTSKLTIDIHAATKHSQKSSEEHVSSGSPLCKPSPSLPCLIGDDDEELASMQISKSTPNTTLNNTVTASLCITPHRSSSKDILTLSPHMKDKQMISPIPKTPTISNNGNNNNNCLNDTPENLNKTATVESTPTKTGRTANVISSLNTTPTSSIGLAASKINKSNDSPTSSNTQDLSSPQSIHTAGGAQPKKKPEIFIPGFDGEIDERISESAVQSISAEFNTPIDPLADEPKIPVESPPDASKLEKLEESKSRVTISQEETESAVSALLGESFGNSSADYSFNDDDDGLEDINNVIADPDPALPPGEPDEEAALAAKAIECEVASSAITDTVEEDTEEVCKAVNSLRQEELDIKADTPQSVRELQIDTDTEENVDEADSSGSHSLKIDETAQSNNSSLNSEKTSSSNNSTEEKSSATTTQIKETPQTQSSVITKIESPKKIQLDKQAATTELKIEPPTINKQDQPAVQPVQAVMPAVTLELPTTLTSKLAVTTATPITTSINTTTIAGVTMSYTSTPIKTSITFAPTSASSSTPKQSVGTSGKPITTVTSSAGYIMQAPTITIPEPSTQFIVPQLVLSPRGVVSSATAHHNDSSMTSSNSMHSPSGLHMPPQSPVGATYLMGVRAQSPHSPRQHNSRGNTPTPRQQSPHTSTPAIPTPTAITPQQQQQQQQQQNILIQRAVQQQQNMMSPPSSQGHVSQNNSPLASPTALQPRQISPSAMHKITPHLQQQQQQSPSGLEQQHIIKINNYSTPPTSQPPTNMINIRIPTSQQQQQQQHLQQSSPQQSHGKIVIEQQQQQQQHQHQQHVVPIGQHILPISVQKMPPVPTHPTIISKVVTVTPQQAQQSMMQAPPSPGGGNMYSTSTSVGGSNHPSRQSPQIIQQLGVKTIHQQQQQQQQQQQSQMQFMQQQHQQRQQQQQQQHHHLMQVQQQQQQQHSLHQQQQQQQKLPHQQPSSLISQQQSIQHMQQQQNKAQQSFVATQQRNMASPQHQLHQQQSPTQSQITQVKVQYQQHQILPSSQQSATQQNQNQQQQQQNVIQTSQMPQRFVVRQHISGMPPAQQQHQQQTTLHHQQQTIQQHHSMPNISQQINSQQAQQNSNSQQKSSPIFIKQQQQQQHLNLQQRQQTPSPQRLIQGQQQPLLETPRVIMSTNQPMQQQNIEQPSTPTSRAIIEQQCSSVSTACSSTGNNKQSEVVSVIRTPTPTTLAPAAVQTTVEQQLSVSTKETPTATTTTSPTANATRSAPLTEENVIKISPPKKDEIEQDSKEDSDYWSAKELNVIEANNSSNTNNNNNTSSSNTVIKKNESVTASPAAPTTAINKAAISFSKDQTPEETKSTDQTKVTDNKPSVASKNETNSTTTTESQINIPSTANVVAPSTNSSQSGNVTTDHDTEDETETQQMPTFEQVPIQGRPSTRGTGAKRGRQPRGGKKGAATSPSINPSANANAANTTPNQADSNSGTGIQTRLRKPTVTSPATRGRKGRPPRNLLLQQQQEQQSLAPQTNTAIVTASSTTLNSTTTTTATTILTAAEKKARSQAAQAAAALASLSETTHQQQQQNQDVYEFHDESGDEAKTTTPPTASNVTSMANTDQRPRLILTIKSPAQGAAPLVKASEKTVNIEPPSMATKPSQEAPPHAATVNQTQEITTNPNPTDQTVAELAAAAANTRKSRRLLEKDRSTIDDIIEDVVRNTNINAANAAVTAGSNLPAGGSGNIVTNVLANTLPKGAQTPPRRSGRNSCQAKPPLKASDAVSTAAPNPIGRPRKSKDRKNTNDLDLEQTPSPQAKQVVHDISDDVEDAKSVGIPPSSSQTEVSTAQQQQQPPQLLQSTNTTTSIPTSQTVTTLQQQKQVATQQNVTTSTSSTSTCTTSTMPQHPKKKALAAAEIESFQQSSSSTTTSTTTSATPNIHSALPAGGVPMLNTAAPASQKTTGGAADSVNKPLIDPVTGIVSGQQMQQAKEGNLPSATAAQSQPLRGPMDPKKMMQAAAAAAAAENNSINKTSTGSVATPITALTKPMQVEATAAQVAASTVTTAMLNKSVSVVVKTSTLPTTTSPQSAAMMQQHQAYVQAQQQQQRQDIAASAKQPIIVQQQTTTVMHAQHTNVRPPTSLKAHVLNSQKLHQQQQQLQQSDQQQYITQQQQQQKVVHQQQQQLQQQSPLGQPGAHVIQNSVVQRQTVATVAGSNAPTNQSTITQTAKQQLLVNIPPPTTHSPHAGQTNILNSPRHLPQHSQQQSLIIKQSHEIHANPQVLHVVSSKTTGPVSVTAGQSKSPSQPPVVHHITAQQPPNASPHPSYPTYIQTTTTSGSHAKQQQQQQQQLPQQPIVIHQQTIGGGQPKTTTTPMVMPPGLLGLPPHPAMVIQTKTTAPAQSPSGPSSTVTAHLQHPSQHTPSPPLQSSHLVKPSNNPMIHTGVSHVLNTAASPSPPTVTVKPVTQQQQSSITSNVGASNMRTAIPTISPQSQARIGSILLPSGMQVPAHFDTNMSEATFPGGIGRVGVPTREHLMIYQQLLRQHDTMNSAALREYDEKLMANSPPLELRRPGSVPRTVAVPHSLQSPQDRATDSPQVAQVYVHNTRIPAHTHYDVTGRPTVAAQSSPYYDATRQIPLEPPPAHRSAAVHSVVAPPPPPTVVVPHPAAGSSSPFMPAAPPATAGPVAPSPSSATGLHTKVLDREREQREREREQQLLREKEQIMVRGGDAHNMQVATPPPHQQPNTPHQLPPHASQQPPPPQADSLLKLLQRYPVMWQGLLALKTDQAAVQMHFVFGNPHVARASLPCNSDGSTPPLRIAQRMRLEQTQLEGVAKKMQFENEHCMLLALPCGRDHADVLQQSRNLQSGFITYLQQKMAAGIVNIAMPGSEQAAYVVHIFPSCDFANENLKKAAPDLKNRVADIAHLLIVIATV